jgi:hypothetical protein
MEYLKAKYQERRAKAPKRIRLTNDSALWDGLEMALRVRQVETGQKQTLSSILPDALVGLKNHSGAFAKASLQRLDLSRAAERGSVWIDADQIKQCDELSMHLYVTETRRQPGEPRGRDYWASRRCVVLAALWTYSITVGTRTNLVH